MPTNKGCGYIKVTATLIAICMIIAMATPVFALGDANVSGFQLFNKNDADRLNKILHPQKNITPAVKPKPLVKHQVKHKVKHQVKRHITKKKVRKKYRKVHATHRYRYVRGYGYVDCWGMSDRIYNQLTSSGQRARIIQYATSMSPRHRSVQVYRNGAWSNYDYSGYASTYHATSNSVNGKVVR